MNELTIKVAPDLKIDPADNKIKIRISSVNPNNNAFELKDDGIYMNKSIATATSGFVDQYSNEFIRVGWPTSYDTSTQPQISGVVSAGNVVHRTYDVISYNGEFVVFRQQVDCIIPGDILRFHRDDKRYGYYLITKLSFDNNNTETGVSYQGAGYYEATYEKLAILDD